MIHKISRTLLNRVSIPSKNLFLYLRHPLKHGFLTENLISTPQWQWIGRQSFIEEFYQPFICAADKILRLLMQLLQDVSRKLKAPVVANFASVSINDIGNPTFRHRSSPQCE